MRDTHYDGSIPEDESLMSNNLSPSTPRYGGDEYRRRLAGLPLQDSPNSDRYSPVFLQLDAHNFIGYGEMTQSGDSGYSTNQDTQVENHDWHRVFSPSPPPRLSQMENGERSLSPVHPVFLEEASPDMFQSPTPRAYALRVRNNLFPAIESQSTVSKSMLDLSQVRASSEHNMLIVGEIINTTRLSGKQPLEMDWFVDGNEEELNRYMDTYEDDEKLNRHMDAYESFGGGIPSTQRQNIPNGHIEIGPQLFVPDIAAGVSNSHQVIRNTTIPPVPANEQWYDNEGDDIRMEVSEHVENAGLCDDQGKIYINTRCIWGKG
ncbi:hypothetical protein ACI65C_004921 [Semiaphis heraclei]